MNTHQHFTADMNADDTGNGHSGDRQSDGYRFFQYAEFFERDCEYVSRRAQVLWWAYNSLLAEQPEQIFKASELASIAFESIGRDLHFMPSMAHAVCVEKAEDSEDLDSTTGELRIAIERLLRERVLSKRYRAMYRAEMESSGKGDQAETFLASVERETASSPIVEGSISALIEECSAEWFRRAEHAPDVGSSE